MVEKRLIDTALVRNLKEMPGLTNIAILDREGYVISSVAKTLQARQDPVVIGALFRSLSSSTYNYKTLFELSTPLVTVSMVQELIFIQINLGLGTLCLTLDKANWPLNSLYADQLLGDVFQYMVQIKTSKPSLLKDLYPKGEVEEHKRLGIKKQSIIDCISQLGKGAFNLLQFNMDAANPLGSAGLNISTIATQALIANSDGNVLYKNDACPEKLGDILQRSYKNHQKDFQAIKLSSPLINIHCFLEGELLSSCPIGVFEEKELFLGIRLPSWKNGVNESLSILYSTAYALHANCQSENSNNMIELLNFLMSDASVLREQIDKLTEAHNYVAARPLMERSSYLLSVQGDLSIAGDYMKWVAFTYFEESKFDDAILFYEKAAILYRQASDSQNLASNLTDMASLYETLEKYDDSIKNFREAETILSQLGDTAQVSSIQDKIGELRNKIIEKIKDFLNKTSSNRVEIDQMAQKLKMDIQNLPFMLNELVQNNIIQGQVDQVNKLFLRGSMIQRSASFSTSSSPSLERMSTPSPSSSSFSNMRTNSYSVASGAAHMDYSNATEVVRTLQDETIKLNTKIEDMEQQFAMKEIKTMQILKYQAMLAKKKFNEVRMQIYREMTPISENGQPKICPICLDTLDPSEPIVYDENYHGFHGKCMSQWIKTQDRCPACDARLLPFVLNDLHNAGNGTDTGLAGASGEKIQELESQITLLKQSLGGNVDIFDKLVAERETKARMVQDLHKKDMMIEELRSILKAKKNY